MSVELGPTGLVSGRHAFGDKRKVVRVRDFNVSFRSQPVRIAIRVDRDSTPVLGDGKFRHAGRKTSVVLAEASDGGLEVRDVFVDPQCAKVFDSVLANAGVLTGSVGSAPQHARGGKFAGV